MDEKKKFNFVFSSGEELFFTSDTHFHHENIIKFCNRPFTDVQEMDNILVERWNKVVPVDATVFHLGDFAWGGYNAWKNVREQLNGDIVLIKGNHDQKNMTATAEKELFSFVTYQLSIRIGGRALYLNHYPFLTYAGVYRIEKDMVWQLYGHTHSGPYSNNGKDLTRLQMTFPTQYDVGVDNNDFRPISWVEVCEKINKQVADRNTETKTIVEE